ncbi:MAG: TetR/AcrR family transcriptional regulator [Candidatus Glassbacteria bacterium]
MTSITRKERKEHTRELLLQSAIEEFSSRGIAATKTVDIARAAGVAHGTVFVHFPTRDDLLNEVIDQFGQEIGMEFRTLSQQGGGVREVLAAHLRIVEKFEPFYAQIVIEGPLLPRNARNNIFLIQTGIALYLEEALARDVERKRVRPAAIHLLVNSWIGTINYYLTNRDKFSPGRSVIAEHGSELLDHFMSGIELPRKES